MTPPNRDEGSLVTTTSSSSPSDDAPRPATTAEAAIEALSLEQRASLGGGAAFWKSRTLPGVPEMILTDGPHGVRYQSAATDHLGLAGSDPATCFPPAVGLAQSWDPDLVSRVGAALADEAQTSGIGVLLGPGINIKRDPRCGRNFEYLSEDPLLTGVLASAYVGGLQSGGVGAAVKHFAANNMESDRMRASSDVDARPLHEIYLRAFERVVRDSQPWMVMTAYNRINGVFASENRWLLTDVLRTDWGFDGAVVSDWGAVTDRVASVRAGLDLQMPGDTSLDDAAVVAAVQDGTLDPVHVDRAARTVATLSIRAEQGRREVTADLDAHHALAREAAASSIVLLKNDEDLLPLAPETSIAVIGAFAAEPRYQGGGSSHVNAARLDIPLDEIREVAGADRVTYAQGFTTTDDADARLQEDAVRAAAVADTAVVFLGLAAHQESEGFDRTDIDLPDDQIALLEAVTAVQPDTVVVLSAGGVLDLRRVDALAAGVLGGALLGQAGGGAIADVLFGTTYPSGRVAETVPLRLQEAPSYDSFPGEHSHVRYGEGIFVGYRGYDHRDREVLYPFGHGLSYTRFAYEDLSVTASEDGLIATVTVRNSGTRAGREVVQLYSSFPGCSVARPPRELVGFGSLRLSPGETADLRVVIRHQELAQWDDRLDRWVVESGERTICASASSRDHRLTRIVHVDGDDPVIPFSLESTIGELMADERAAGAIAEKFSGFAEAGDSVGSDMEKMLADMPIGLALKGFAGVSSDELQQFEKLLDGLNQGSRDR